MLKEDIRYDFFDHNHLHMKVFHKARKIFLNWGDMYSVDVTFVNTKGKYKEVVTLPTLEVLIDELEEQRKRTVGLIKDMLKEKFGSDKEREDGKPF